MSWTTGIILALSFGGMGYAIWTTFVPFYKILREQVDKWRHKDACACGRHEWGPSPLTEYPLYISINILSCKYCHTPEIPPDGALFVDEDEYV